MLCALYDPKPKCITVLLDVQEEGMAQKSGATTEQMHLMEQKNSELHVIKEKLKEMKTQLDVTRNTLTGKENDWTEERRHQTHVTEKLHHEVKHVTGLMTNQKEQMEELQLTLGKVR